MPRFKSFTLHIASESGAAALDKLVLCFGMVLVGILASGTIATRQNLVASQTASDLSVLAGN